MPKIEKIVMLSMGTMDEYLKLHLLLLAAKSKESESIEFLSDWSVAKQTFFRWKQSVANALGPLPNGSELLDAWNCLPDAVSFADRIQATERDWQELREAARSCREWLNTLISAKD